MSARHVIRDQRELDLTGSDMLQLIPTEFGL